MSDFYRNTWRGYLIDHHMPNKDFVDLSNIDYGKIEKSLVGARIDHLLLYFKDHWGYCYYESAKGPKHPTLTSDFCGRISEICKRNKIAVWAYYCSGFDHYVFTHHPEWALKDGSGNSVKIIDPNRPDLQYFPAKWYWMCSNNPYIDYQIKHLREIISGYNPDGLFIDIVATPLCYCSYCQRSYREIYGKNIPQDNDLEKYKKEIVDFQQIVYKNSFEKIVKTAKEIDSTIGISLNGGNIHFRRNLLELVDFIYAEPIPHKDTFVAATLAKGLNFKSGPAQIGPGTVSNVYDPKPKTVYLSEMLKIISNGVRPFLFSGSMDTKGIIAAWEFDNIAYAFKKIKRLEKIYREKEKVKSIAILFSEPSNFLIGDEYLKNLAGAIELGIYSNYPIDVISTENLKLDLLAKYELLIIAGAECMAVDTAEIVKEYVFRGGSLIIDGLTSIRDANNKRKKNFLLSEIMGCSYLRTNFDYQKNYWGSFIRNPGGELFRNIRALDLGVIPPLVETKKAKASKVVTTHTLPCEKQTDEQWVNWWSPPPGMGTNFPAIIYNKFGKGKVLFLSFNFFKMQCLDFNWIYPFFNNLLRFLLKSPIMRIATKQMGAIGTAYLQGKNEIIITRIDLNIKYNKEGLVLLSGGILRIDANKIKVKSCEQIYPVKRKLKIMNNGTQYTISLPNFELAEIIKIDI